MRGKLCRLPTLFIGKVWLRVYVGGRGEENEAVRAGACRSEICVELRLHGRQSLWLCFFAVNLNICVSPRGGF